MLSKKSALKSMAISQCLGFVLLVGFIWADESFDLSNRLFNQPKASFNIVEAISESGIAICLAFAVVWYTTNLVHHIKYLEGFISLCAFCKKVHVHDNWIPLEEYLTQQTDAEFSHGFCPECAQKHYGSYLK